MTTPDSILIHRLQRRAADAGRHARDTTEYLSFPKTERWAVIDQRVAAKRYENARRAYAGNYLPNGAAHA